MNFINYYDISFRYYFSDKISHFILSSYYYYNFNYDLHFIEMHFHQTKLILVHSVNHYLISKLTSNTIINLNQFYQKFL